MSKMLRIMVKRVDEYPSSISSGSRELNKLKITCRRSVFRELSTLNADYLKLKFPVDITDDSWVEISELYSLDNLPNIASYYDDQEDGEGNFNDKK